MAAFQFPALPGSSGFPVQFVLPQPAPIENLSAVAAQVMAKAPASHKFYYLDQDLKLDAPQEIGRASCRERV